MVRKSGQPFLIDLRAGDYRLVLEPERGGSIALFEWRGRAILRPTCGPSMLDTACFPLVPFSNRIASGRFSYGGMPVRLNPNLSGTAHPLHGYGWLSEWQIVEASASSALLEHRYPAGGEWPWRYVARQRFDLEATGLVMALSITNLGASAMPAGLGYHPYFQRYPQTRYLGRHTGEWQNSQDCLPVRLDARAEAIDWWCGQPVGNRIVDTVYGGRSGALAITHPDQGLTITLSPSENLPFTVVYTPDGEDYFCVEPVSHITNAHNLDRKDNGLVDLLPGQSLCVECHVRAEAA
ncbi:MAG: aldose 1-epimerase [Alphaproteobacteria bacterium]|nr:aldose 1-epimerase [Alphaproteobacteria bacterium]MDE2043389.1 aldose 1-epimerase [Alphaproteobacteria bacterium]